MKKRVVLILAIAMLVGNVNSATAFAEMTEIEEAADIDVTDVDESEQPEIFVDISEEDEDTAEQYEDVENADLSEDIEMSDIEEDLEMFSSDVGETASLKNLTGMYFTPDQTDLEITPDGNRCFTGTMTWDYNGEKVTEKIDIMNGNVFNPYPVDGINVIVMDSEGTIIDKADGNGKFWFDAIFEKEEIPGIVSTSISSNNLSIT